MNGYMNDRLLSIKTSVDRRPYPPSAHDHQYEPTPYAALDQLFSRYKLLKSDRFVDMGCGKGRIAFYVNHRFQASVVGIEVNPLLHVDALKNKKTYRKKMGHKKGKIDFLQVQAQNYEIDEKDTVFYFFNPFSVQIFIAVIQRMIVSVEKHPRPLDLILYYPSSDYVYLLQNRTPFELVEEVRLKGWYERNNNERFLIYRFQ